MGGLVEHAGIVQQQADDKGQSRGFPLYQVLALALLDHVHQVQHGTHALLRGFEEVARTGARIEEQYVVAGLGEEGFELKHGAPPWRRCRRGVARCGGARA
ncbi:hypothetical protein D3C84_514680 [compost metagenome]